MEDLNTYAEASIPIDQAASIEIKLFPNLPKCVRPSLAPLGGWQRR